jgi:hypothetical protein
MANVLNFLMNKMCIKRMIYIQGETIRNYQKIWVDQEDVKYHVDER